MASIFSLFESSPFMLHTEEFSNNQSNDILMEGDLFYLTNYNKNLHLYFFKIQSRKILMYKVIIIIMNKIFY